MDEIEHVIIIGAGFNALMCALEAQQQRPLNRQVDIIAEVIPSDPSPARWTTNLSRSCYGSYMTSLPAFEEVTFAHFRKLSESNSQFYPQFMHTEYFANEIIEDRIAERPQARRLSLDEMINGFQQGICFRNVSVSPSFTAESMMKEFLLNGGRLFRGSVRHIREVVAEGVKPFTRADSFEENMGSPHAIVVCIGLGARFIGGIEDKSVSCIRIPLVKLRAPWVTAGKALYDKDFQAILSLVPTGNGDIVVAGKAEVDEWQVVNFPSSSLEAKLTSA
ncbi:hypothetical protein D9611_008596 [Ephemerocybe angulata]|uniref:FAD dependent oxidoreductase domain-containing protein n=1 Tax=Ephemerocybe angulata TaxID=980116 RepID=A0A8H5AYJ5_9AGAR|nr:hypothetical protein D9611_008596 [Tulosesus angulatus]